MILYYSPGACSLVPHVALKEAAAEFRAERVVLARGEHLSDSYRRINPHARVPALEVEGQVITENVAILNYIADRWRAPGSVPVESHLPAARCNQLLGWFASSVHIGFAQVWRAERFTEDAALHEGIKSGGHDVLKRYFTEIESLSGDDWTVPGYFTAADTYLLTFFRWGLRIGHDMSAYPRWRKLADRVLGRSTVLAAIEAEGLGRADFQPGSSSAATGR